MIYHSRKIVLFHFLMILLYLFQVGCGVYSFSSAGRSGISSVAIPLFQDQTAEFGIKEKLTDEVVNVFTRDNTLKVTDRRNADSLLEGKIINVDDQAGAFTREETVQDIKITISVSVQYQDLKKRKTMWEEVITQWGTFNPDAAEGENTTREGAIDEAVVKIAGEILNKSVSGW